MKLSTVKSLEDIARSCVAGLEEEIRRGLTTPETVREVQSKTKNPTRLEVIKSMVRADMKKVRAYGARDFDLARKIETVMKSSEQFNYLANAIDARIKRRAWSDPSFDSVYRGLFGVRPRARSRKA